MRSFKRMVTADEAVRIAEVAQSLGGNGQAVAEPHSPEPTAALPLASRHRAPAQTQVSFKGIAAPGQTLDVPLHAIVQNPLNSRKTVSSGTLDDLAASMRARGQEVPAMAFLDNQGRVCLIDGHRRMEAARIVGLEVLRVEVRPAPENEMALYMASRTANVERENQTPLDDALAWKDLLERRIVASQAELCRQLGLESTTVSRTLGLADLPRVLVSLLAERPDMLNLRMLDAIRRYYSAAGESATETLIIEADRTGLSARDIDARRNTIAKGPATYERSAKTTLRFAVGQATLRRFEGQGRMQLEVGSVTDEAKLAALAERIGQVLVEVLGVARDEPGVAATATAAPVAHRH